jgi:hypothetical protein
MPFRGVRQLADAVATDGREWQSFFFKNAVPNGGTGRWVDGSVGSGIPLYNAYVGNPLEATPMTGAGNRGIYVGPDPEAGQEKYLHVMQAVSNSAGVPVYMLLADYLMFYPLIDGDSTDQQDMDNTLPLTRYTSGEGVQCMIVVASPMSQNGTVSVSYTNSDGVSGRTSNASLLLSTVIGSIANTTATTATANAVAPFIPLASGDRGIRSIESVTVSGSPGGLLNAVLVKPLAHLQVRESGTAAEKIMVPHSASCPKIDPGAYLNWILHNGNANPPSLRGFLQFAWG